MPTVGTWIADRQMIVVLNMHAPLMQASGSPVLTTNGASIAHGAGQ